MVTAARAPWISGVARIFVGGHPADATQPYISRAHVEAVADSGGL